MHFCMRHLSWKEGKMNIDLWLHGMICVKERKIQVLGVLPQKAFKSCFRCNVWKQIPFFKASHLSDLRFCFSPRVEKQNLKSLVLAVLLEKEKENSIFEESIHIGINQLCFVDKLQLRKLNLKVRWIFVLGNLTPVSKKSFVLRA